MRDYIWTTAGSTKNAKIPFRRDEWCKFTNQKKFFYMKKKDAIKINPNGNGPTLSFAIELMPKSSNLDIAVASLKNCSSMKFTDFNMENGFYM
jgi:hypothetical protein